MSNSTNNQDINSDSLSDDKLQSFITSIIFMGTADKAQLYDEFHTVEIFTSFTK